MEQMSVRPGRTFFFFSFFLLVAAGGGAATHTTHHLFRKRNNSLVTAATYAFRAPLIKRGFVPRALAKLEEYVVRNTPNLGVRNAERRCRLAASSPRGGPRRVPVGCQKQLPRQRAGQYLAGAHTPPAGTAHTNFRGFARN